MKSGLALSVLSISLILLSGCVSKAYEPLKTESKNTVVTSRNGSVITVQDLAFLEDYNDTQLRLITRQDTANMVAAKTVQAIAGMFLGIGVRNFDKNDLKGHFVATQSNPFKDFLTPQIIEIIKAEMDKRDKQSYEGAINVMPDKWRLVYKNLAGGDDNYQLILNVSFSRVNKERRQDFNCDSMTFNKKEYTLPEWQANNYAKVTEVSHQIMDTCAKEFSQYARVFLF